MQTAQFDRRKFLKAALFASGALITTPIGRARAQALSGTTVIVVGAGISGLGAAQSLLQQGATVIVVEGRDRIGGRLYTDWSMGVPFEVGAGWIHGPASDNPTRQLADAVGSKYAVTEDDSLTVFDPAGEEMSWDAIEEANARWADILSDFDENLETSDSRSLLQAINDEYPAAMDDPILRWAFTAHTEFSNGAPLEKTSVITHDDDSAFDEPDVVVTTGYDSLLKPLAEGVDIRFGATVTDIAYGEDGVTVETSAGPLEGDYCVCSVSMGVLKSKSIAFAPALPSEVNNSIETLGFGTVTKIAFKFDEAFWDTEEQYFGIMTEQKGRWCYWLSYRTFSDENVFLGLSIGGYAPIADKMSDAEMTADALSVLRGVWGDDVGEPTQVLTTHWSTDPFALGAYTYPMPGTGPDEFEELSEIMGDSLVLCGEHTIFDYKATTHGAYMSGLRAAEQIIELAS